MRIEDLRVFTDAVLYHSMTIAAEKHYMTPQNLSRIIKNIESEIGVILFKRSTKGSQLTEAGERFYVRIVRMLNDYDNAVIFAADKNSQALYLDDSQDVTIKVLSSQGAASYAVLSAYKSLRHQYGDKIYLDLDTNAFIKEDELANFLDNNHYDIAVCFLREKKIQQFITLCESYIPMHLLQDELVLLVSKKHPLATCSTISGEKIQKYKLVSSSDTFWCSDLIDENIQVHLQLDSMNMILEQVVYSDEYYALACRSIFKLSQLFREKENDFVMIPFDKKTYITFAILIHRDSGNDRLIKDFIQKIVQNFSVKETY